MSASLSSINAMYEMQINNASTQMNINNHGRGAMSFAMNVAEILRTLQLMDKYSYQK